MIKSTREGWGVLLIKYKILIKIRLNTYAIQEEPNTKAYTNPHKTGLHSSHCYPPLGITNWKPTKLNNIEWNISKCNDTRGLQKGIEVK